MTSNMVSRMETEWSELGSGFIAGWGSEFLVLLGCVSLLSAGIEPCSSVHISKFL